MVLVPVTVVVAALFAQSAVAAPAAATPLAARAPSPSSSAGKKPMTLPLPEMAKTLTHSVKFKAAASSSSKHPSSSSSKHHGGSKKEHGGSSRENEEFEHHRDERKASHKGKGKGKSHRGHRKTNKRRLANQYDDDGDDDSAQLEAEVTVGRREPHHEHDGARQHENVQEPSHGGRYHIIKVYERDHDYSHSHESERRRDYDRTRRSSGRDHERDHAQRSLLDVDVGSYGPQYYNPPAATYLYEASSSPLVDVETNLKKRDGTTYYYYDPEPDNLVDLEVNLKRRGHDHVHDHYDDRDRDRDDYGYDRDRHDYDYDYDRHGHEHVHRRANAPLNFAPLFKATGNGPFKYVGAKQNAVPVQKDGKSKRDNDDNATPDDSCPELNSAVKGYLQLVTETSSSKFAPLAELALGSDKPAAASPFIMDGSTNAAHATVYLVKQGDQSDQGSGSSLAVKFVVKLLDTKTESMSCLCTTYNPGDGSPLMLLPCSNNSTSSVSQNFAYDTATTFIAPLGDNGSPSGPSRRSVPAPGMLYAQDGAAENVALPPPAQSTKMSTSSSSTSASATGTIQDEEPTTSSESPTTPMTPTSSSLEAAMTDKPGSPATVTETATPTVTATPSIPGVETGAEDKPLGPTTVPVDPTESTTTSAIPTPTDAMSAKDIYLSFTPNVDNIKPVEAAPSEVTTATEATTATESTTTTSATATVTDSVAAPTANAKHTNDGIPAAVISKPQTQAAKSAAGEQEEDDDLPDCYDDDDDDSDSVEDMVPKNSATAKVTQTLAQATQTASSTVASATDADAPAVPRVSKAAAAPTGKEDWTAPYRMRFVRDQNDWPMDSDGESESEGYDNYEEPSIQ
ncbi:hypothetical protein AURDEDRAFT_163067 [Auricularia subglabra TFB-10046 SS5]|nr:hypothetical protein AURDEDRAFT_163067 [Auricularia subglabra TFB-10046 SS5]